MNDKRNFSLQGNNPLYLYRYDSVSSEASLHGQEKIHSARQLPRPNAPILPKRSISLPQGVDPAPPRPPLPRSILRKNRAKRCSMFEMGQLAEVEAGQDNKRMSLQEPYFMNNDLQLLRMDSEKDIDEAEERQRFGE